MPPSIAEKSGSVRTRLSRAITRSTLGLFRNVIALNYVSGAPTRLASGSPTDSPHGSVDGRSRLHILVVGGLSGSAIGVPSYGLGVAALLARSLARETGRGVDWESLSTENPTLASTAAALRSMNGLASFDVIIVCPGSADVLAFNSFRAWRAELAALMAFLDGAVSPSALVAVAEVPDVSPHVQVGRLVSRTLELDGREFNAILADTCRAFPRVQRATLPAPEASDFIEGAFSYSTLYRRWAAWLSEFVMARLSSV
ncbi:SGNH/GDSL hydrolase family protein [Lacisediminihabitans sp. FW035]